MYPTVCDVKLSRSSHHAGQHAAHWRTSRSRHCINSCRSTTCAFLLGLQELPCGAAQIRVFFVQIFSTQSFVTQVSDAYNSILIFLLLDEAIVCLTA